MKSLPEGVAALPDGYWYRLRWNEETSTLRVQIVTWPDTPGRAKVLHTEEVPIHRMFHTGEAAKSAVQSALLRTLVAAKDALTEHRASWRISDFDGDHRPVVGSHYDER